MGYCTQADVEAMFKSQTFTADTVVTDTNISDWIDRCTEIINAKIRNRYVVPVIEGTNPEAFKVLQQICQWKVASQVEDVLRQGMAFHQDQIPFARERGRGLAKMAREMLEEIETGALSLKDVTKVNSNRFVNPNIGDATKCAVFVKGKRQW